MNKFFTLIFILVASFSFAQEQINWVSIEEAEKIQLENPDKPMFIDVYTDWCGWCKKMDKSTFVDEEVVAHITNNYIPVKFDAEYTKDINFKNRTFKFVKVGNRGFHQLAAVMLQGQLSFPSYLVLNSEGVVTHQIKGYVEANDLLNQL
ncbi:MAG: thioredoxin family protein [Weeksellaceae bacterium]